MKETIKVLMAGDVVGKPGRKAVAAVLPRLREKEKLDFCVVNGENIAGGSGLNEKTVTELIESGANVITTGDHIWRNKEVFDVIRQERRLLRPANFPPGAPGKGSGVFAGPEGVKIGVINLLGRVFLSPLDCPFRALDRELDLLPSSCRIILVDFHAEATSEKRALTGYADGRVSAVVGTHTHIPTADGRITEAGTAAITDLGMTGSLDSILGREVTPVIQSFLTGLPHRFAVAGGNPHLQGVVMEIDLESGRAISIKRVDESLQA